jgi:ABC-type lipoprotein export system ATPase subunit
VSTVISSAGVRFRYPGNGFEMTLPDWSVTSCARVGVMGPSGCGKSTLLNLLAGVLRPTSGRLEVCGSRLETLSEAGRRAHRIQNVGFVFQDFPLVEYLTVTENVLLPFRVNPVLPLDRAAKERCTELLELLEITHLSTRKPGRLSQGERQRAAIARALVTEPTLLLADEPTAGLDPRRSEMLMELLKDLSVKRELTLVMVSHDRDLCAGLDSIIELGDA